MTGGSRRRELVLATANPGKAAEIAELLSDWTLHPRPTDVADVLEDGATLEDNARLKAMALLSATGLAAVADDTGLEVDALDGAPGVRSARFAGEDATDADNVAALVEALREVEPDRRTARFRTVAVVCFPDGSEVVASGEVEGTIAATPRGGSGFGYDPLFVPRGGDGRTFAEMTRADKHEVSHRGRAFRALAAALEADAG